MITSATADGTLYTRDWDTEPLFPLPSADETNKVYACVVCTYCPANSFLSLT